MFKRIFIMVFVLIAASAGIWALRPMALREVEKKMAEAFPGASVSISQWEVSLWHQIVFFDVVIEKGRACRLVIPEVRVEYDVPSLFKRKIARVTVAGLRASVDVPTQGLAEARQSLVSGGSSAPGMSLEKLAVEDASITMKAKDLDFRAHVSAVIRVEDRSIELIDASVPVWESFGMRLENVILKAGSESTVQEFSIANIQFDKARVTNLHSLVELGGDRLIFSALTADTFGGQIKGHASIQGFSAPKYQVDLSLVRLDLEGVVDDFELRDKFQMSGFADGQLVLAGQAGEVTLLKGDFLMDPRGGILTIKDTRLLENMARATHQPMDIIVESLRQYRYNNGILTLSLEDGDLILDMALDGETGQRNLLITLHDVL